MSPVGEIPGEVMRGVVFWDMLCSRNSGKARTVHYVESVLFYFEKIIDAQRLFNDFDIFNFIGINRSGELH